MSTFKFAEQFGVESPLLYNSVENVPENEEIQGRTTSGKVRSRAIIKFHYGESDNVDVRIPDEKNDLYVYVRKLRPIPVETRQVTRMSHSGITYRDIEVLRISLGRNLRKAIAEGDKNAQFIVDDLMTWMEINNDKYFNDRAFFLDLVKTFVAEYPTDYVYEPPNGFEQLYDLFVLCIELGVIDLSNTAGYLSNEVFRVIANGIRSGKLGEERWNPNVETVKHDQENTPEDATYNPLFFEVKNIKTGILKVFDGLNLVEKNMVPADKKERSSEEKYVIFIEDGIIGQVNEILSWLKDFVSKAFDGLVDLIDRTLKMYNAYVVGLINGFIELIAGVVDAIGFLVGLFHYESLNNLIRSIQKFVDGFSWNSLLNLIKKELKELFNFIDGDEMYKNAYEFGLFIPKILEAVLDIIGLVKGVAVVGIKIAEIAKDLPKMLREANKALFDLVLELKIPQIDKKVLKRLQERGISLEVRLTPSKNLNSGIPIKVYEGKEIKIWYKDELLEVFDDEKLADVFLKKLESDEVFFNNILRDSILKRAYESGYKKVKEYPRITKANVNLVFEKFGLAGKTLFSKVEKTFEKFLLDNKNKSGNWIRNRQLISGMSHKDFPNLISAKTNFPKDELYEFLEQRGIKKFDINNIEEIKVIYSHFGENLHKLIEERIKYHLQKVGELSLDTDVLLKTGGIPGIHAEVRALNDLFFKLEAKGVKITEDIFDDILGYNRMFKPNEVMPRCADCYYLTFGIRMISLN